MVNLFLMFSSDLDLEVKQYAFTYGTILFKYSILYIFWWMIWQLLIVFQKGKAQIFIASLCLTLNILLDYIFVKYLNYWVEWIAYATVFTWFFTNTFGLYYVILRKKITSFTKNINFKDFTKFLSFANSTFFVMLLVMWTIIVDNYFFWKIGTEALSSYWIGSKLKDLVFYPIIWTSIAFSILYGYFYWEKDSETMKKIISFVLKIWIIYSIILLFVMPIIWKVFWWFFTSNELTLKYLLYYMFFSSLSMFWYVFEFIYWSVMQITSHHKIRIFLNILFLIFVFTFEYIFYEIFKSYVSIWIWAVIASLSVSYLTYLYYKIKIEGKV
jgi:Na+-driven multidrug efflux pump